MTYLILHKFRHTTPSILNCSDKANDFGISKVFWRDTPCVRFPPLCPALPQTVPRWATRGQCWCFRGCLSGKGQHQQLWLNFSLRCGVCRSWQKPRSSCMKRDFKHTTEYLNVFNLNCDQTRVNQTLSSVSTSYITCLKCNCCTSFTRTLLNPAAFSSCAVLFLAGGATFLCATVQIRLVRVRNRGARTRRKLTNVRPTVF